MIAIKLPNWGAGLSQLSTAWERIVLADSGAERLADAESCEAPPILVSDTAPTGTQRRVALGVIVILSVAFAVALPVYDVELAIVPSFVPVVHAVVCITGLIAAAFLFSQYAVQPQPAFLVLASGYSSAGLFAFFQSLAFPDSYSATGLLGGGPSTAAWLFLLWRTSFPLGILGYALIRRPAATIAVDRPVALPIAITFVCVVIGACCLTWMVTIVEPRLPLLFSDATHEAPYVHFVTIPAIALSVAAVALLWLGAPQRSISG